VKEFGPKTTEIRKATVASRSETEIDRSMKRILLIGPGFGMVINPDQANIIEKAGYRVFRCTRLPNPDQRGFDADRYLDIIAADIERFQPHVVAAASKGGIYVVRMWKARLWQGPTLLINAHPSCRELPLGMPVVLAHGSNDEIYPRSRRDLEALLSTGSPNQCFLYFTSNSGVLSSGRYTRIGDGHIMASLLKRDCLPRLVDSLFCQQGPEVHMMRTWRDQLCDRRIAAENWLGCCLKSFCGLWTSRVNNDQSLFKSIRPNSHEFQKVVDVFKALPRVAPTYQSCTVSEWGTVRVVRVERIENMAQINACSEPYYSAMIHSLKSQGLEFEAGVHSCWAFHGCHRDALDLIVEDPLQGFRPSLSPYSPRSRRLWGAGTYFARDASYVVGGRFCGAPDLDGTRKMLMCLLFLGMPCAGDPQHVGSLPYRQKAYRYNSSVDSLSSPEIYIMQHSGAIVPAYVITFTGPHTSVSSRR